MKLPWWKSKQERAQEIVDRAEATRQLEIQREHSEWFNARTPQEQQLYLKVVDSLRDDIESWEPLDRESVLMQSRTLSVFVDYRGIRFEEGEYVLAISTWKWWQDVRTAYDHALMLTNRRKNQERLEKIEMKLKELESR